MNKLVSMILLGLLCALQPVRAADNLQAFPPAEQGMIRYVLQLPHQADESAFQVELIVGKTVAVDDRNRYFFGGRIAEETIQGLGLSTLRGQPTGSAGRHADGGRSDCAEGEPVDRAGRRTLSDPLQQPLAGRGVCARRRRSPLPDLERRAGGPRHGTGLRARRVIEPALAVQPAP